MSHQCQFFVFDQDFELLLITFRFRDRPQQFISLFLAEMLLKMKLSPAYYIHCKSIDWHCFSLMAIFDQFIFCFLVEVTLYCPSLYIHLHYNHHHYMCILVFMKLKFEGLCVLIFLANLWVKVSKLAWMDLDAFVHTCFPLEYQFNESVQYLLIVFGLKTLLVPWLDYLIKSLDRQSLHYWGLLANCLVLRTS